MKQINWGIIGCGDVTEVKSGPAFNLIEGSKLVAVMRRNAELARDYAIRHKVPKWFSNADELINDAEVNAIYVATPPDSHAEYAIRAMKAGKPVYVEKPMAMNYLEAIQMLEVSEETEVPLFVAYYRRALPGFLKVKELIESGAIGEVRMAKLELFKYPSDNELRGNPGWRVDPRIAGAGHFFDLASHQLDYLDYIFGPIQTVNSMVVNHSGLYEAEDFVSANFKFANDVICSGIWSFSCSKESSRDIMEFIGAKGTIKFSCFGFGPIMLSTSDGIKKFDLPKPAHVQQYLIQDIVKDLQGKGKSPSNGVTAARTTKVLAEVVQSYYR